VVLYLAHRLYPIYHSVSCILLSCLGYMLMSPTRISSTIIAPTPLLAATFIIFSRVVQRLGTEYSRLTPKWCMYSEIILFDC
jgi:hypothetical protein